MKNLCKMLGATTLVALSVLSCTNKKYDLENINTEITLGGNGIVAPIGHIDTLTLDSLLGKLDLDILDKEDNGDLKIGFDSTINFSVDAINIDPISNIIPEMEPIDIDMGEGNVSFPEDGFKLPTISYEYDVNIPEYTINDNSTALPTVNITVPTDLDLPSLIEGITIPAGLSAAPSVSGYQEINLSFPCPEQVKKINKIWFANNGAKVDLHFDFNSLAPITDQRIIQSLIVTLPTGYVVELEDDLNGTASITNGNKLVISEFDMGDESSFSTTARLKAIDMSHITPTIKDGKQVVEYFGEVNYNLQCTFTTKTGVVSLDKLPSLSISLNDAEFGDAEIVSNEITLDPINTSQSLNYSLGGMSPDVASVLDVKFDEGSSITLAMNDMDMPFVGWDECEVEVELPQCFKLNTSALVGATINGQTLTTTLAALQKGISLPLDRLDFGDEGAIVVDEQLIINESFAIKISPKFPSATYRLSDITAAMGPKKIIVSLERSQLYINTGQSHVKINQITRKLDKYDYTIQHTIDNIPSELKRIESISVVDENGEPAILSLAFSLTNSPISHAELHNIKINLPQCLWIEAEGLDENNVLTIDKIELNIVDGELVKLLDIKVLGIRNLDVIDGSITIDDKISIEAEAVVKQGEVISGTLQNITLTPEFSVPTLCIKDLVGRINLNIEDYVEPQSFDLSEISDALEKNNIEANLGIKAPNITLDISNPIGVSIDGVLNLTASYTDKEPLEIKVPVHLNGAEGDNKGITRLCVTANADLAPAGYTPIVPEGYERILENIPNAIAFSIEGGVTEESVCQISLGKPYDFDLNISIQVPFEFNGNTDISYNTLFEVGDIFGDFGDMGIEVGEVGILLNYTSTLPLEFDIEAQAVDVNGTPVEGIDIIIDGNIGGCETDYMPKHSQIFIGFKGNSQALPNIHAITLGLKGSTGGKESKLNSGQYIVAKAILRAKDGFTIDLKELLEGMTTDEEEEYYE